MCCSGETPGGELERVLDKLLEMLRVEQGALAFDYVLVETSGLADVGPILQVLPTLTVTVTLTVTLTRPPGERRAVRPTSRHWQTTPTRTRPSPRSSPDCSFASTTAYSRTRT